MKAKAPIVATWLAERFLTSAKRESLIGDLIEQYRDGRSAAWYWGQVLRAIIASMTENLIAHKFMAVRALGLGLALYSLLSFAVVWVWTVAQGWMGGPLISCEPDAFWCQFSSNQFSAELLVYSACVLSGWMMARLHGEHAMAAVWLYSAAVLLLEYATIGWMLTTNPAPPGVRPTTVIVVSLVSVLARPVAVLVGGLWGARNQHAAATLD